MNKPVSWAKATVFFGIFFLVFAIMGIVFLYYSNTRPMDLVPILKLLGFTSWNNQPEWYTYEGRMVAGCCFAMLLPVTPFLVLCYNKYKKYEKNKFNVVP